MSLFHDYLKRQLPLYPEFCVLPEETRSTFFVTIPCYDEPDLITSLRSLAACTPPAARVTVIIAVNDSDKSTEEVREHNLGTVGAVRKWWAGQQGAFFDLLLLYARALPSKWAGVGWGRKIAMDEAIRLLDRSGAEEGIIAAFDADSTVSPDYFTAIEQTFLEHPKYQFVNLPFAHPVDDPALTPSLRTGIILYELYLRYLRNAMRWCGYPHAIHTVGSSFAVKASAYVKQGGMNRRQAGEDFHFLHKIVQLGPYGIAAKARVYPAARVSHRVPFGTGAALQKWERGDTELMEAYSLQSFTSLRPLLEDPAFFFDHDRGDWEQHISGFHPALRQHMVTSGTLGRLEELKKNCRDRKSFSRRFFHEVSAFWIIQYLNQCEALPGGRQELTDQATHLLVEMKKIPLCLSPDARTLLDRYREIDADAP